MSFLRTGFASFPRRFVSVAALVALIISMQATWQLAPATAKPAAAQTAPQKPAPEASEREAEDDEPTARSSRG
jgi:hypothetical protein